MGTSYDTNRELRAGDVVRVRSEAEILATLDADGRLDGMPFMPEMLQQCGREVQVYRRADKTCDTIGPGPHRRLTGTVHLADLRCGGEAHGGCQAACLLFWKEAWLQRVEAAPDALPAPEVASTSASALERGAGTTREMLLAATLVRTASHEDEDASGRDAPERDCRRDRRPCLHMPGDGGPPRFDSHALVGAGPIRPRRPLRQCRRRRGRWRTSSAGCLWPSTSD